MDIGAIFCTCRGEIGSHLNLEKLKEIVKKEPDVKFAEIFEASCSIHDQETVIKNLYGNGVQALLFIGCSPKYYETQFQEIFFDKMNINPGLIKFANIREQVAWAHRKQDEEVLIEKASNVVSAALEQLRSAKDIETEKVPNLKSVLVIGGGISGIHATLALANQGYYVYLI